MASQHDYKDFVQSDSKRPFRLWAKQEGKKREPLRYRNYKHFQNAHIGALVEARWANIGTEIAVVDVSKGLQKGFYRRRIHDVYFEDAESKGRQPKGE